MPERGATRLQKAVLFIARIMLGYLFFTQLFWKFPPQFGCPPDFAFTTGFIQDGRLRLQRTSGLCDWVGIESVYATQPRPFFVADLTPVGGTKIAIDLGWLARLNGIIIDNVVIPNIQWMGWLIWIAEAFIAFSLILGFFTRLGGLTAILISTQLMIGLAGIPNPYEWEWAYNLMVILSLVIFAFAPGYIIGLDQLIKPRLDNAVEKGSRVGRALSYLTY
jgi:uncharacterized membrane protein YphA (DoxX/SURF4 family)